jgi:hypothetical protein
MKRDPQLVRSSRAEPVLTSPGRGPPATRRGRPSSEWTRPPRPCPPHRPRRTDGHRVQWITARCGKHTGALGYVVWDWLRDMRRTCLEQHSESHQSRRLAWVAPGMNCRQEPSPRAAQARRRPISHRTAVVDDQVRQYPTRLPSVERPLHASRSGDPVRGRTSRRRPTPKRLAVMMIHYV